MKKSATIFACSNCGGQFPKWAGQCLECGKWGTIAEDMSAGAAGGSAPEALSNRADAVEKARVAEVTPFSKLEISDAPRMVSGIAEVDRVLGGGFVAGELVLIGGDPGIGKSTLVAQIAGNIASSVGDVLYVSGEESGQQIQMRLERLGVQSDQLLYSGEQHVESICKTALSTKPRLLIIDSIQTIASSLVDGEPGSVNQLKACTVRLLECAKQSGVPILIIGHVTKGGELGGPKMLEHIVDAVLYLEGDRQHQFRLLRAVKNRFGSTSEIGVFQMREKGLEEVPSASALFIDERSENSGSVMSSVLEGNRVFLIEVQALVTKTSFGYPERKCSGFDVNRLNMLLAVLQRRAGVSLEQENVYINVVGGLKFVDPSLDAAVCLAIVSALNDFVVPKTVAVWGEIGLGGEVRSVSRLEDREREAKRFGLTKILSNKSVKNVKDLVTEKRS
jgi:DNA repair protein RadA/Sms